MTDLVQFLRDRYAERRAIAEAAAPWPWKVNPDDAEEVLAHDGILVADVFALSSNQTRNTATFIAANDPADVIADLGVKLAIVEEHSPGGRYWPGSPRQYCKTCGSGEPNEYPTDWPCRTLRILARSFINHPDHKGEEWAP
ncbi:DUF6221 family protein [Streptomyces sp. NPDC005780]|uniref:DUF6221 family protein n=1 Tax=Streptomyces sp. NPDC005780 TaxID=3364730 RepID=UPI0036C51035